MPSALKVAPATKVTLKPQIVAGKITPDLLQVARGRKARSKSCGDGAHAAAIGELSRAIAQGKNAVAVAAGTRAHAKLLKGNHAEAVAAAGAGCFAETYDAFSYLAAVGTGSSAISHCKECPSVAVGYQPFALAPDGGIAISIGTEPAALAGINGTLVFVDTASIKSPHVHIVKVCPQDGIRPDVPYWWQEGMDYPEVDIDKLIKLPR